MSRLWHVKQCKNKQASKCKKEVSMYNVHKKTAGDIMQSELSVNWAQKYMRNLEVQHVISRKLKKRVNKRKRYGSNKRKFY